MKTLIRAISIFTSLFLITLFVSCLSDSAEGDNLSQYTDYKLEFLVSKENSDESYDLEVTYITTNADEQIVEQIRNYSGDDCCIITDIKIVKSFRVVGLKFRPISNNLTNWNVTLKRASDNWERMNESGLFDIDTNMVNVTYSFLTNLSTVVEN